MEHVVFGGVDLADRFICLIKERPLPSMESRTQHIDGSDRYTDMGADILPEPIVVKLVCPYAPQHVRRELSRWLGSVLYSKEPRKLLISSDEGLWHTARLAKTPKFEELVVSGSVEVTFQPMEAWMYGDEHSVTVPSGGSVTFLVRGSYPTAPKIEAASASGPVWGVRLDEEDFLHVELSQASSVQIDCDQRICLVGDSVSLPTLDSNWIYMTKGQHTMRNDQGAGTCVLTWTERWL